MGFADERSWFKMRRVEASGAKSAAVTIPYRVSGYQRITRRGKNLLAWSESGGESHAPEQIKGAIVHLP